MLVEKIEDLKEWLTASLLPICEADPGALAKYVIALVKKDKTLPDLKESCVDQLEVFLQSKTKPFVDTLFEVIDDKSYVKPEPPKPEPSVPDLLLGDDVASVQQPETTTDAVPPPVPSDDLVTSTSRTEPRKEDIKEDIPPSEVRPRRSRSPSPRFRAREDDRRRRYDERRPYGRGGYGRDGPRRRSTSPRFRGLRSRSPYRRRSPFRPIQRSRSPKPRGRGRGRSRSRSWSRSWSRSPRWSRSRSRSRDRLRSRSPGGRLIARSKSPRRDFRARSPRGRSPYRRSPSPRYNRSRSPGKRPFDRSKSSRSRSPIVRSRSADSRSPRSGSMSPARKVSRRNSDSRGPTPTDENGLVDSANAGPSHSSISVVTGRYVEAVPVRRVRCRDFDEKGFCVRGDLCVFDHGADPVVVENVPPPYPPGVPPPGTVGPPNLSAPPPGLPAPPPGLPGGPVRMNVPPPGFFNRMPGPHIRPPRPDFPQEPYNPEAPGIGNRPPPPYWPGGPDGPPPPQFMRGPPPPLPLPSANRPPVHSRLGNRDLVPLTIKKEVKEESEDDDSEVPSSSSRTVIAPKEEPLPIPAAPSQPPPPGVPVPTSSMPIAQAPAPGYQQSHHRQNQQRFHPYQHFMGPRKPFDYNRVGGYRRPDQTNCTLEVRKVPGEFNNIAKLNEHFGKFGTLTNIQVKYEGDPEAALVSYSSNQEALSCYKCSDPVFNNRFIKVFWHQKNKTEPSSGQEQAPTSTTPQGQLDDTGQSSMKSRLGPAVIPPASKLALNNLVNKKPAPIPTSSQPLAAGPTQSVGEPTGEEEPHAVVPHEKPVAYTTSMGHISRTVYNTGTTRVPKSPVSLSSPTAVHAADFVSRMEKVKHHEELKKEAALKKLEIQKQKQHLLGKQIEQQKLLIASLEKNKDMKESSKKSLMETLKTLTLSIDKLKCELGGRNVVLKSEQSSSVTVTSPEQAKKEILDVELELMTKTSSGEDTLELKKKLAELTKVANSMGLLGRGRGRATVARGRGATTWVASGVAPLPTVGRGRGRGAPMSKTAIVASRTLDRRPKMVEVTGFVAEEKEDIITHINGLKGVEKMDMDISIPKAVVTFNTRREAELGILHGSKFKTKTLKMTWHIPKPEFSRSASATSADTDDQDIDEDALLAGVDDEEDDTEDTRSWRR